MNLPSNLYFPLLTLICCFCSKFIMKSTKVQTLGAGYAYSNTKHLVGSEDARHYVMEKQLVYS